MSKNFLDKFTDICQETEWELEECGKGVKLSHYLRASCQKFVITPTGDSGDTEDIIRSMVAYYRAFDVEEYVTDKLIAKRNGASDIPALNDLIMDAEEIPCLVRRLLVNLGVKMENSWGYCIC